jgi:hypothetical protein
MDGRSGRASPRQPQGRDRGVVASITNKHRRRLHNGSLTATVTPCALVTVSNSLETSSGTIVANIQGNRTVTNCKGSS